MAALSRSYRRLLALLVAVPLLLLLLALLYQAGMAYLEGQPRTFGESLQWAAATMTTTGFGRDTVWHHPVMEVFVVFAEFAGVILIFLIFPIFFIPFLEERFEVRLPTALPDLEGHVLIYRYGPAVSSLLEELEEAEVPAVIFEEDEGVARRLHERKHHVVLGELQEEDPDLSNLTGARGLVLNGDDDDNAAMVLNARYHGYQGPVIALVANPSRRPPMLRAGANIAFVADHVLAAVVAARASVKISPRLSSVRQLGSHLQVAELRVHAASPLANQRLGETRIRARTGAAVVGLWSGGAFLKQPDFTTVIHVGDILVVVGGEPAIARLGELATPVRREGPFLVLGHGNVGRKVAEFLRDAGETVRVLDAQADDGVDIAGDPLSPDVLKGAGAAEAQAVVLALATDSANLFAAAVVRNLAPDVVILAGARRAENVSRIHRAGADFALSVGQVAGQLLAYHLLGRHSVSLEADLKLVASSPGGLAGEPQPLRAIRERTRCAVIAVERGEELLVEFDPAFRLEADDVVYLSGTNETIADFFEAYPDAKAVEKPRPSTPVIDGTEEGAATPAV